VAKRVKYALADLPEAGTVFAMPLADGRVGVCRVLRRATEDIPRALVAASDWISSKPPPLDHPAVRKTLTISHHNWWNSPVAMWVSAPPPKEFRLIGRIAVTPEDTKAQSNSYTGWESFALHVLSQWRWDNEREAVVAEDKIKQAAQLAKRQEEMQKRTDYLSKISFSDLLAKDLFSTWDEYPPEKAKEGCQEIIRTFIRTLAAAKEPIEKRFVSSELKKCVECLNQFDAQNNNFIETIEREDICEALEDVVNAAKFPKLIEKVENWRDW